MRGGLYIARSIEESIAEQVNRAFAELPIVGHTAGGMPIPAVMGGAITASGLYGLTLEKMFNNGAAINLEAEDLKVALVQDAHTPDFNLHDFYADLTNEVSGTGYTAGGKVVTGTELTMAAGLLTYDGADVAWAGSTITDAMAAVGYADVVTDELVWLSDFVTSVSTTSGTLTVAWHANGIWTLDYTP